MIARGSAQGHSHCADHNPWIQNQPSHHLLATGAYHGMRNTGPRRRARERARKEPGPRRPPRRRTRRPFGATLGRWSGRERLRAIGGEGRGSHRALGGGGRDYRRGRGRSSRRSDPGAVNGTRPITERGEEDNPGQAARTERPWRTRPWLERPSRSRRGTCRAGPVTARRERPCRSRRGTRRPGRARPGGTRCAVCRRAGPRIPAQRGERENGAARALRAG